MLHRDVKGSNILLTITAEVGRMMIIVMMMMMRRMMRRMGMMMMMRMIMMVIMVKLSPKERPLHI